MPVFHERVSVHGILRLAAAGREGLNRTVRPLIQEIATAQTPESLVEQLAGRPGTVLLRSAGFDSAQARYSFVAASPFLTFRSSGLQCEIASAGRTDLQFGNPWHLLDALMARYEMLDEIDLPFPLGGCFGYWGYELKNFTEPKLPRRAVNDLELPDCHVGFYDSLVVFDHRLGKASVVATGLSADGSRSETRARKQAELWTILLADDSTRTLTPALSLSERERENPSATGESAQAIERTAGSSQLLPLLGERAGVRADVASNVSRSEFLSAVERAQRYIRAGHIYQVNLSQRLAAPCACSGWELFGRLLAVSPAPFAAYFDCGDFQIVSSSPEQFLRLSGSHITTRPIKGTRPRSPPRAGWWNSA